MDDGMAAAQVDAAAALLAIPVHGERRRAVIATMLRLAAFAADVAAVDLSADDAAHAETHP